MDVTFKIAQDSEAGFWEIIAFLGSGKFTFCDDRYFRSRGEAFDTLHKMFGPLEYNGSTDEFSLSKERAA
jgi:hypothetical protein